MAEFSPEINFDIGTGQLLIGEAALQHHLEVGGHPADVFALKHLLNNDLPPSVSFSNIDKSPDRWAHLSREDILEQAKWLMGIADGEQSNHNMFARRINRASRLGLMVGRHAIESPRRFNSLPEFQQALSVEGIIWRDRFKDWDDLDLVIHLHKIGEEEGRRPDMAIISRRAREGRQEPGYRFIRKRMPLPEAYERAGFIFARDWDRAKFDEWGVLFYMANKKHPTQEELNFLSAQSKGPSSHSVDGEYGGTPNFGKSVEKALADRLHLKRAQIKRGVQQCDLPRELYNEYDNLPEAIRRTGRFKVISLLLPSMSTMARVGLSMYDISGQNFVDYLAMQDQRITGWAVEAAAFNQLYYPELFPNGELIKSLKLSSPN